MTDSIAVRYNPRRAIMEVMRLNPPSIELGLLVGKATETLLRQNAIISPNVRMNILDEIEALREGRWITALDDDAWNVNCRYALAA